MRAPFVPHLQTHWQKTGWCKEPACTSSHQQSCTRALTPTMPANSLFGTRHHPGQWDKPGRILLTVGVLGRVPWLVVLIGGMNDLSLCNCNAGNETVGMIIKDPICSMRYERSHFIGSDNSVVTTMSCSSKSRSAGWREREGGNPHVGIALAEFGRRCTVHCVCPRSMCLHLLNK